MKACINLSKPCFWENLDLPSDRNIQAKRSVYRFGSLLISRHRTMWPTRRQARVIHGPLSSTSSTSFSVAFPGRPIQLGIANTAHQTPHIPMAMHSDETDPPPIDTGMVRKASTRNPVKKPTPTPMDDIRDVVSDKLDGEVTCPTSDAARSAVDVESIASLTAGGNSASLSLLSSEDAVDFTVSRAREGRNALAQTMLVPYPTLPTMVNIAAMRGVHVRVAAGKKRKATADSDPV